MYLMRPEGRNENIYLKSWYTYISWRFQSILVPFNMPPNSKRMRMRTHWRFRDLSHFSFGPLEKHEMWLLFFLSCLAFFSSPFVRANDLSDSLQSVCLNAATSMCVIFYKPLTSTVLSLVVVTAKQIFFFLIFISCVL